LFLISTGLWLVYNLQMGVVGEDGKNFWRVFKIDF